MVSPSITANHYLGRIPDSARVAGLNISVVGAASSLTVGTDEASSGSSKPGGPTDQEEATGVLGIRKKNHPPFLLSEGLATIPSKIVKKIVEGEIL